MKFGLAVISYVYSEERASIVSRSLRSLARTNVEGLERPVLDVTYGHSVWFDYRPAGPMLDEKFYTRILPDPPEVPKPDTLHLTATAAAMRLLQSYQDITHVVCMVDDFVYNPEWLHQLADLIGRHPTDTRAWSVYRSRFTDYHRIVGGDGTDVLMSMHDSIGCVTRQEMQEFCRDGFVAAPDISHAQMRPGNRWATSRDWMENIGLHHDRGIASVDCAIDFVGEE